MQRNAGSLIQQEVQGNALVELDEQRPSAQDQIEQARPGLQISQRQPIEGQQIEVHSVA